MGSKSTHLRVRTLRESIWGSKGKRRRVTTFVVSVRGSDFRTACVEYLVTHLREQVDEVEPVADSSEAELTQVVLSKLVSE